MKRPARASEKFIRHPLEALGVVIIWVIFRILPIDVGSAVGGWLGRTLGPGLRLTERARRNIRRALPELSDAEVEHIVVGMWDNLCRMAAEFPHIAALEIGVPGSRVQAVGREHLYALRDDGAPGLLFGGHLANWELSSLTMLSCELPTVFIYREANNPLVERIFMRGRRGLRDYLFRKGGEGAKGMIGALRDNGHVGMLIDQKMNDGIPVPFFGRDAMTAPALAQMALKYKCPVVAMRVVRLKGAHFRVDILPPIYAEDTGDRHTDIARFMANVNKTFEDWIREHPEQWLWLHNRWPEKS